jgi:uncharacterized protein YkwD
VKKPLVILMMILWACAALFTAPLQHQETSIIEDKLLESLNKERTVRHLSPLRSSPGFKAVAMEHSRDMATHQNLTHLSSSGKSYLDRVVDARLFFIEIGENVAVSDTFDAEFIHQGFMESLEHRDNILDPGYDAVGIGVVYSQEGEYFITQDFVQSLNVLGTDEAETVVKAGINSIRKNNALPPLSFQNVADSFARRLSKNRASGKPLQKIAEFFGETHVHFVTTPLLVIPENISREIASENYETGAVGAWFGRLEDYPGGTYLITIFLFPVSPYRGLKEKDCQKIMLGALNEKREKLKLGPLKLDRRQSNQASKISRQIMGQQADTLVLSERPIPRQVMSYVTENLRSWPDDLNTVLTNPSLRRIGIGIRSQESSDTRKLTFWITLIIR